MYGIVKNYVARNCPFTAGKRNMELVREYIHKGMSTCTPSVWQKCVDKATEQMLQYVINIPEDTQGLLEKTFIEIGDDKK